MLPLLLVLLADAPKPKLPVGPDTTVVSGPVDADGWIDFEAALNDRLAKDVTPETNANVLLWKAIGPAPQGTPMHPDYWTRLGVPAPPADGRYWAELEVFLKGRGREADNPLYAVAERLERRPWKAADHPDFAAWLERNETPLAVVVEAVGRPRYYNPLVAREKDGKRGLLIGALLPNVQRCRSIASALCTRAMRRAADGQFDAAWADLQSCRRLARHVAGGGTLIELLVGVAVEARAFAATQGFLAARTPTAEQAAGLLRDLDALPPLPGAADKIGLTERYLFLDSVQHLRRGGGADGLVGKRELTPAEAEKLLAALNWGVILQTGNRWYDRIARDARLPTHAARTAAQAEFDRDLRVYKEEVAAKAGEIEAVLQRGGDVEEPVRMAVTEAVGGVVIGLMLPAGAKVQQASDRAAQQHRLLRLAVALAAHRADAGAHPEALAALAPKYLPAIDPDLFTDKPPVYKKTADGYLLSSVGPNGTDDGGTGDDLTVRMPPAGR